ncbi:unnamed protein product [Cylindrotheca closterium]|uniref:Uncharacterized protein n=1 Tax=Cylindrotheca closterium TaxID=2856 RepID=A0AAD2FMC2_9STRA|nr:unnamed protein product [Cylindrotheca closterium]
MSAATLETIWRKRKDERYKFDMEDMLELIGRKKGEAKKQKYRQQCRDASALSLHPEDEVILAYLKEKQERKIKELFGHEYKLEREVCPKRFHRT